MASMGPGQTQKVPVASSVGALEVLHHILEVANGDPRRPLVYRNKNMCCHSSLPIESQFGPPKRQLVLHLLLNFLMTWGV